MSNDVCIVDSEFKIGKMSAASTPNDLKQVPFSVKPCKSFDCSINSNRMTG